MDDDLKPCPFCGSKPYVGSLGGNKENWAIWCTLCGWDDEIAVEMGIDGDTKEEIIKAWNRRVENG